MNKFTSYVVHHPKLIIALTLVLTAIFAVALGVRGIKFNGSPETLARNDEALNFFKETLATFGSEDVLIVALESNDIFTSETKARLDYLTNLFAAQPNVTSAASLSNASTIQSDSDGIIIDKILPANATTEQLQQLKVMVTSDPLYAKNYISKDGRTAAINVFLKRLPAKERHAVSETIERLVKNESRGDLWIAGLPLMDAKGVSSMVRDISLFSPIAAVLCFMVFFGAFRSFWGALLPMLTLGIGLTWTVGLMALAGKPFNLATIALPTVLMAVGSSYIFHILNQYRLSMSEIHSNADKAAQNASWYTGCQFITPAVLVSGTTTVAGFAALTASPVPAVKDMGLFQAAGVAFMLLLTLTFIPAMLSLLSQQALGRADVHQKDYATWMNGMLKHITALILFRKQAIVVIALAATLLIGAGIYRMRVNTDFLKVFPRESDISQTAVKLHTELAGASVLQIVVSGEPNAVKTPEFAEKLEAIEAFALQQEGIDAAVSVADIIKKFNANLPGTAQEKRFAIPGEPKRLASIFDNYLSQDEAINKLVTRDFSKAAVVLRTNLFGSKELHTFTEAMNGWLATNLPPTLQARVTGAFILLNDASDAIAASQASSLSIALVTIYFMMVLLFRSFATGLLALIPNLLPIAGFFGFLGWTGITLDITTSLIASSVLGLAVDNAVHMIRRFRQSLAERKSVTSNSSGNEEKIIRENSAEGWAMWLTMLRTGKPMTLANLMLIVAFLIFLLSEFYPVRIVGLLWALTVFACLVADLIFLPALIETKLFRSAALGNPRAANEQLHKRAASQSEVEKVQ
ncbi:MAG: MMPL family transporter [Acidobacteriota bacterium]